MRYATTTLGPARCSIRTTPRAASGPTEPVAARASRGPRAPRVACRGGGHGDAGPGRGREAGARREDLRPLHALLRPEADAMAQSRRCGSPGPLRCNRLQPRAQPAPSAGVHGGAAATRRKQRVTARHPTHTRNPRPKPPAHRSHEFIPLSRGRAFPLPPEAREWLPADDTAMSWRRRWIGCRSALSRCRRSPAARRRPRRGRRRPCGAEDRAAHRHRPHPAPPACDAGPPPRPTAPRRITEPWRLDLPAWLEPPGAKARHARRSIGRRPQPTGG
jgi:hypothetical protein